MAFFGCLKVGGKDFKVLEAHYHFGQDINVNGEVSALPQGGMIQLSVEAQQGDGILFEWMQSHKMVLDGSLIFYKSDINIPQRKIHFTEAFCVRYSQDFHHASEENLRINCTISCKTMTIDGVEFKNNWK